MLKRIPTRVIINYLRANCLAYLLLVISLIMIFGAPIYYFYALNWPAISVILILSIISFFKLHKYLFTKIAASNYPTNNPIDNNQNPLLAKNSQRSALIKNYRSYWPHFFYILSWSLCLYILYTSRTDGALISPWQVVPPSFFFFYVLTTTSLVIVLLKKNLSKISKLFCLSAYYFLSFSVALIVYKIAYGFDSFIHQATMELIAEKGLVNPKPFYYLGEYSLVTIIHKLSGLTIYFLNKFLVPFLAAIFLPWSIYRLVLKNSQSLFKNISTNYIFLTVLFILIIGFSPFIISTPQNFSYLFLILTIVFGLTTTNLLWPLILALATFSIHPLTGIPAICWWLFLTWQKNNFKIKKSYHLLIKYLIFIISALALPLALLISGANNLKSFSWNFYFLLEPLTEIFNNFHLAGQENWYLNFIYFWFYNYSFWLTLIIMGGLFTYYKYRDNDKNNSLNSLIFINIALVIAYLLSRQIIFKDVINYEQANFSSRILVLMVIFSLPFIFFSVNKLLSLLSKKNIQTKSIWLLIGLGLLCISIYVSYPRFDNYYNSRGYSTGANDFTAVNFIDEIATKPYIVLANQQVSAAALQRFGFDNYLSGPQGEFFFYPIPTGGELYQYYLDMVYKNPDIETMAKARELTGASESYLVVNKYWNQSARIIEEAKLYSNYWHSINDEVFVFQYLSKN